MKYIVATIVAICTIGMIACSNDGGESMVLRKNGNIDCNDFRMFTGTPLGGEETKPWAIVPNVNRDSMYRRLVTNHYFRALYNAELGNANNVSFEFVGNDMLMYVDDANSSKIVSNYFYKEDSLFVVKVDANGKEEDIYVASKDQDNRFYRMQSIYGAMVNSKPQAIDERKPVDYRVDMDDVLKLANIASLPDMIDSRDTIMWCNVRYNFH